MTSHHNQKLQDAINEAKKHEADTRATLEVAQKQEDDANAALDEAKKQRVAADAGFITFIVSSAGLVSKCRIPVAAVAQRGLFRILLGSPVHSGGIITDVIVKMCVGNDVYCNSFENPSYTPSSEGADGNYSQYHTLEGMHAHDEQWNHTADDTWLINVGGGIY